MAEGAHPDTLRVVLRLCHQMVGTNATMRFMVLVGAILEIAGVAAGIFGPFILKMLVDGLGPGAPTQRVLILVALFVLSWSGASILSTLRSVYSTKVIDRMTTDLATTAIRHQLPVTARMRSGDSGSLLGLLERLPYSLTVVVDGLIWRVVPIFIQLFGSLCLICTIIPAHYAAILAAVLIGYAVATWAGAREYRQRSTETSTAIGELSKQTGDVLRNARRVVLNGALDREVWRLEDHFHDKTAKNGRMMWSLAKMVSWQYAIVGIGLVILLSLGAVDVVGRHMTIGSFVLLQAYALRLAVPLSSVGFVVSQSAVAISNIGEVFSLTAPPEETSEASAASQVAARIQLKNIDFSYNEDRKVLQGISLDLAPGSFTVIVGPNGSGKSTLAQIMAGVFDPERGQVLIDGRDLKHVQTNDRHRFILYVPQFIGMFNRSLSANGLYPPTTFSELELSVLLSQWRFYEEGRKVDLEAFVGEQGERLSGGQIQKLELARLAGVKVSAVVLDESTSALDPVSETKVIKDLQARFDHGTTLVMISHRIEIASAADTVLFMSGGRIVAQGTHQELLAGGTAYKRLWA